MNIASTDMSTFTPFHKLEPGDKYQHRSHGKIEQVVEKVKDCITIRRSDGWLIHCRKGDFVWVKMVIKVTI